jgi:hypothetical protein
MPDTQNTPTQPAEGESEAPRKRKVNPYEHFEPEIMQLVIGPKLVPLIQNGAHESKAALLLAFNEAYECDVSMSAFNRWLELLGIQAKKVALQFQVPDTLAQAAAPGGPDTSLPPGVTPVTPGPVGMRAMPSPEAGGIVPTVPSR